MVMKKKDVTKAKIFNRRFLAALDRLDNAKMTTIVLGPRNKYIAKMVDRHPIHWKISKYGK